MSSQKTLSQKATRESLGAPYDVHLTQRRRILPGRDAAYAVKLTRPSVCRALK